jgi:hypothetical protein
MVGDEIFIPNGEGQSQLQLLQIGLLTHPILTQFNYFIYLYYGGFKCRKFLSVPLGGSWALSGVSLLDIMVWTSIQQAGSLMLWRQLLGQSLSQDGYWYVCRFGYYAHVDHENG